MVKVKEGYVMNAREQAEYGRVNALPRKASGTVAYYFKPQTKYPPRIYVFMHAEVWCDRNRRPMGLHTAFPFLTRPMNRGEIEYHHFDTRLCYHQYEDWGKLLFAEEKEAEELDRENAGSGTAFMERLRSFQSRYVIGITDQILKPNVKENTVTALLSDLLNRYAELDLKAVSELLDQERQGEQRTAVLILLRKMYRYAAGDKDHMDGLTLETLLRKAEQADERRRKIFVRRVFKANPLFAVEEIRTRYADYDTAMLTEDLCRRSTKIKRSKRVPILDLRRVQLQKLALLLSQASGDEPRYNALCQRIAILQQAHDQRCPIPIAVKLGGKTEVYYFHWKTRETVVKAFVTFANGAGQTHAALKQRHHEVTTSNYSF